MNWIIKKKESKVSNDWELNEVLEEQHICKRKLNIIISDYRSNHFTGYSKAKKYCSNCDKIYGFMNMHCCNCNVEYYLKFTHCCKCKNAYMDGVLLNKLINAIKKNNGKFTIDANLIYNDVDMIDNPDVYTIEINKEKKLVTDLTMDDIDYFYLICICYYESIDNKSKIYE